MYSIGQKVSVNARMMNVNFDTVYSKEYEPVITLVEKAGYVIFFRNNSEGWNCDYNDYDEVRETDPQLIALRKLGTFYWVEPRNVRPMEIEIIEEC